MTNVTVKIHKAYRLSGAYYGHMREVCWRVNGDWKMRCCPTTKAVRRTIRELMDNGY